MATLWLPSDDRHTLARREPNLLVPGRKPLGNLTPTRRVQEWVSATQINGFTVRTAQTLINTAQGAAILANDFHGVSKPLPSAFTNNRSDWTIVAHIYVPPGTSLTSNCRRVGITEAIQSGINDRLIGVDEFAKFYAYIYDGVLKYATSNVPVVAGRAYSVVASANSTTLRIVVNDDIVTTSVSNSGFNNFASPEFVVGRVTSMVNAVELNVLYAALLPEYISDAEAVEISRNSYSRLIFEPANSTPYLISVPTGGATVTLSSPTATATGSTTATVGCTVTYT